MIMGLHESFWIFSKLRKHDINILKTRRCQIFCEMIEVWKLYNATPKELQMCTAKTGTVEQNQLSDLIPCYTSSLEIIDSNA